MKTIQRILTVGGLLLLTGGVALAQQKTSTAAGTLHRKGQNIPDTGFFVRADDRAIYFSGNESGAGARPYLRTAIEKIVFDEPASWTKANEFWAAGDWANAARAFQDVAEEFKALDTIEGNYGSLARLRQLESLRKLGKYKEVEQARLFLKKEGLNERFHSLLDLYVGWGTLARLDQPGEVEQLDRAMRAFRDRQLPARQAAQSAYLSGVANDKLNRISEALSDYHRAMTLDFGSDEALTQTAMDAALALYARDEAIALDAINLDRRRLREAHGLGAIYKKLHGSLPSGTERFGEPMPDAGPVDDEAGEGKSA